MRLLLFPALLFLAGCGAASDPAAVGVSPSEAEALNDAAEMLDQTAPPPSVLNPTETNTVSPQPQPAKETP